MTESALFLRRASHIPWVGSLFAWVVRHIPRVGAPLPLDGRATSPGWARYSPGIFLADGEW